MSRKKSGSTVSAARKTSKSAGTKRAALDKPAKSPSATTTDKARKDAVESIQRRLDAGERKSPASGKSPKSASSPRPPRASAINVAAELIAKAGGKPMSAVDLVQQMEAKGLWKSPGGKTPAATLSAAIGREIKVKGPASRFAKAGRGLFVSRAGTGGGAGGGGASKGA